MRKVLMSEIDERGIVWEYVIILDKKLNCFRVFEGNKVNKDRELIFRYAINSKRVEAFNNKDNKYLLASTVNNEKCFGPYNFKDGEFILA
mgnify:CR=1 FL=1